MTESEPCTFIVDRGRYLAERRPCANWATDRLGDIWVCPVHLRKLRSSLEGAIRWGSPHEPRQSNAFEDNAQWFLLVRNALDAAEEQARKVIHAQRSATRKASSVVYFVERDGFVKIGYTANLRNRMRAISKGSCLVDGMTVGPVRLLATVPGDVGNESYLHAKFAASRVDGEWFLLDDELWSFITALKGYQGEPKEESP